LTLKFYKEELIKYVALIVMKIQISCNERYIKEGKAAKFLSLQICNLQNWESHVEFNSASIEQLVQRDVPGF
jgi:hypothetical protein